MSAKERKKDEGTNKVKAEHGHKTFHTLNAPYGSYVAVGLFALIHGKEANIHIREEWLHSR